MTPTGWIILIVSGIASVIAFRAIPRIDKHGINGMLRMTATIGNAMRIVAITSVFCAGWLCACMLITEARVYLKYAFIASILFFIIDWMIEKITNLEHRNQGGPHA